MKTIDEEINALCSKPIAVVPRSVADGTDTESRSVMRTIEKGVLEGRHLGLILEDEDWRRLTRGIAAGHVIWCSYPDLAVLGPNPSAEILRQGMEVEGLGSVLEIADENDGVPEVGCGCKHDRQEEERR
jgi:hypothetical protein